MLSVVVDVAFRPTKFPKGLMETNAGCGAAKRLFTVTIVGKNIILKSIGGGPSLIVCGPEWRAKNETCPCLRPVER